MVTIEVYRHHMRRFLGTTQVSTVPRKGEIVVFRDEDGENKGEVVLVKHRITLRRGFSHSAVEVHLT